jgi:phosphoenolpyruvate carboxylase
VGYSLVVCAQLQLLGSLLDDVLKSEVGTELFNKVERIRSLAQCAAQLANKHDSVRQKPSDNSSS